MELCYITIYFSYLKTDCHEGVDILKVIGDTDFFFFFFWGGGGGGGADRKTGLQILPLFEDSKIDFGCG